MQPKKTKGFTLIELMIAVAIVGILLAIAIPNYQDHLRRAARSTGQSYLSDLAQRQELRFQNARTYSDQASDFPAMPTDVSQRYATPVFSKTDPAAGTLGFFSITMTPLAGLLSGDGDLYIDSTGLRERIVGSVHHKWN